MEITTIFRGQEKKVVIVDGSVDQLQIVKWRSRFTQVEVSIIKE